MSNGGDDVLDNWEEIDEVRLANTLQKIQAERLTQQHLNSLKSPTTAVDDFSTSFSKLDSDFLQKPMKLLQRTATQDSNSSATASSSTTATSATVALKSPLDNMADTFQPVLMVLHKPVDEYQSANYTPPISSQTVKILRRPTQSSEPRNNGMRPRQPIKTLQQREQEYAEARLRILGSAKNPEDDVAVSNANSSTALSSTSASNTTTAVAPSAPTMTKVNASPKTQGGGQHLYNNHYQQQQNVYYQQQQSPAYNSRTQMLPLPQQQQQQIPQQQTWSPVVGGSVSSPTIRHQQQDSILRMPRGPDGSSTGFNSR